jgi:hypothetical protein
MLGDLLNGDVREVEVVGIFADEALPAVEIAADLAVLIDDGRDLTAAVLGLAGAAVFGFGAEALGAGRAFCGAEGAADVHVLDFLGALRLVTALLPPELVSLRPSGLVAV